jgi:hypothetical protein
MNVRQLCDLPDDTGCCAGPILEALATYQQDYENIKCGVSRHSPGINLPADNSSIDPQCFLSFHVSAYHIFPCVCAAGLVCTSCPGT